MNFRKLALLGIISLSLAACGVTGEDAANPSQSEAMPSTSAAPTDEFKWTEEILYNATLESSIIDAWGYEDVNGESSIGLFSEAPENIITNYYSSPKPAECAPLLDLYVARQELDAEYYSLVNHYNEALTDFTSFTLFVFTYPSEQEAIDRFQSAVDEAPTCGNFDAIRKSEIVKVGLWDEPEILEQNLIQGSKNDTTNTYGRTGSTIWTLEIIDVNESNKTREVSNQAIPVIQERLESAQNLS